MLTLEGLTRTAEAVLPSEYATIPREIRCLGETIGYATVASVATCLGLLPVGWMVAKDIYEGFRGR